MNRMIQRRINSAAFGMVLAGLLPAASAWLGACGEQDPATTGKRVELGTSVTLADVATGEFVNAFGFTITLERALISIGELRYFEGQPIGRTPATWFGVRSAWAHPGHYQAGEELGEQLEPQVVDLLATPTELAVGQGVTGQYHSAWFTFHSPPTGPLAEGLAGAVVLVEGAVTGGGSDFAFRATATRDQVLDTYSEPVVSGCPFRDGDVTEDGTVTLSIDPALWLDQVDFARVTATEVEEIVVLEPAEAPHQAFVRGLRKAAAYSFSFHPGVGETP